MTMKIIILNGPNLNLLGEREKEKYGQVTLGEIEKRCKTFAKENKIELSFFSLMLRALLLRKYKKLEILTMV